VGDEGEDLQDEVGDESPHQVLVDASVEQGHIGHGYVNATLFGEGAPLVLDVLVISTAPVNAGEISDGRPLRTSAPFHTIFHYPD
jgi:hypothetical protein